MAGRIRLFSDKITGSFRTQITDRLNYDITFRTCTDTT
ncbi:hypothetical protein [Morganella morganii IS15]|nr:hypothetical protein [Morganella morganii IS15]